jgi:hypothetical protein
LAQTASLPDYRDRQSTILFGHAFQKVDFCGCRHIPTLRDALFCITGMRFSQAEGAMNGMVQSTPTTLNEHQISILFKCAVKDDETLIDAIVERLYGKMKEFDGRRADRTVGLIVDRDATGEATLRAFLDEVLLVPMAAANVS